MKKVILIILLLSMCLGLCACGAGYGVKTVSVLVEQEYSLAFRTGDSLYYYVSACIETLAAEGRVDELAIKWFGDKVINFHKDPEALSKLAAPEPRTFIIGVDVNSFPMAYISNGTYWGFDIELAMAVTERLGWELQMQSIEKENVYVELSSGNIDCAWGGIALDETEIAKEKYAQYGPYVHNDIVIAAREGGGIWNKLRLSGRNMAMCSTDEALDALSLDPKLAKRLGQITRLAGGTPECFEYLYSGKCDAVLTDSMALRYYNCH